MRKILVLISLSCTTIWGAGVSLAQERVLSVEEMFRHIDENNTQVVSARKSVVTALSGESVADSERLPDINVGLQVSYLGDATLMSRSFGDVTRAPMPHFGNGAEISIYQPLYTGGALTATSALARSRTALARANEAATSQNVRYAAMTAYFELFRNFNLRAVYAGNIELTRHLIDEIESRVGQGAALHNDVTRYELRLSSLLHDRVVIDNNIAMSRSLLTTYMGVDASQCCPDTTLLDYEPGLVSAADWKARARYNAPQMSILKTQRDIEQNQRRLIYAERLPKIGITAGDNFNGPITIEVPPINKNLNYWWIGLSVKYNLSSLFKTNKKERENIARIIEVDSKLASTGDAIDCEIDKAWTAYLNSRRLLDTQKINIELARENYRIVSNRYSNGLALLTDMLDASTTLLDAQTRYENARVEVLNTIFTLKYLSGTL